MCWTNIIIILLLLVIIFLLYSEVVLDFLEVVMLQKRMPRTQPCNCPDCGATPPPAKTSTFNGDKENFENELPGLLSQPPIDPEDYNYEDIAAKAALEQTVFDSHKQFADDRFKITQGSSALGVMDHDNNINSFVGLSRPQYSINGKDMNGLKFPDPREVPTETFDQLPNNQHISWMGQ